MVFTGDGSALEVMYVRRGEGLAIDVCKTRQCNLRDTGSAESEGVEWALGLHGQGEQRGRTNKTLAV